MKVCGYNVKKVICRNASMEEAARAVHDHMMSLPPEGYINQSSKPVKYAQPVPAAKDAKLAAYNHYHPVKSSKYDDGGDDFDRDACIEDINYYISLMDDYKLEQLEAFAHNLLRK